MNKINPVPLLCWTRYVKQTIKGPGCEETKDVKTALIAKLLW